MGIIEDLIRERKLRSIAKDKEKSDQSIKIAEAKLATARELAKAGFYEQAVLSSYTSMFHVARALLYRDGMQEKSHYAVYVYLKEKYSSDITLSLIESFLSHQNERKEILYGFGYDVTENEAISCIEDAEEFLGKITRLLK